MRLMTIEVHIHVLVTHCKLILFIGIAKIDFLFQENKKAPYIHIHFMMQKIHVPVYITSTFHSLF